ncbi:zinc ribbon domain-containing protein [candidate division KSB1 bacterium]|nr:zinc ribbon domain-containing protein [candidate division KSB1 bacterium]
MPIYEYKCRKCGTKFELLQNISGTNKDVICPKCGASCPVKQFSVFASSSDVKTECTEGVCPTCNLS